MRGLLLFGTATIGAGCDRLGPKQTPGLAVGGAHIVLPPVPGRPATLYFVVDASSYGTTPQPLPTLAGVTVEGVGRAEIHQSMTIGGMARMRPLASVPLAGGVTRFCPGGLHVMLFDLKEQLKPGVQARVHLRLSNGKHLDPDAKVVALGQKVDAEPPYNCAEVG